MINTGYYNHNHQSTIHRVLKTAELAGKRQASPFVCVDKSTTVIKHVAKRHLAFHKSHKCTVQSRGNASSEQWVVQNISRDFPPTVELLA